MKNNCRFERLQNSSLRLCRRSMTRRHPFPKMYEIFFPLRVSAIQIHLKSENNANECGRFQQYIDYFFHASHYCIPISECDPFRRAAQRRLLSSGKKPALMINIVDEGSGTLATRKPT